MTFWLTLLFALLAGRVAAAWFSRSSPQPRLARTDWLSYSLLLVYIVAIEFTFVVRTSRSALFEQGLSRQNLLQVGVTAAVALWAFFLVTSRRVPLASLFTGPARWVSLLIAWYAVGVVSADRGSLSAYRVIELAAVWIVAARAFRSPDALSLLRRALVVAVIAGAASTAYARNSLVLFVPGDRSNGLAPLAVVLILFAIDSWRRDRRAAHLFSLIWLAWALYVFDSLASYVALAAVLVTYLTFVLVRTPQARLAALCAVVSLASLPFLVWSISLEQATVRIASIYGRSSAEASTWTGRWPLYSYIADAVTSRPFGFGLGSDRLIALRDDADVIGWEPLHAHSGFMAALYSGGFVALTLLFALLFSLWSAIAGMRRSYVPLFAALIVLLVVNNMTIVGFGAVSSSVWVVVMALAVVCGAERVGVGSVREDEQAVSAEHSR